jgi:polyisoprenoid-binding protein YceI
MTGDLNWTIDTTHSEIGFKIKHLMIANVRGIFKTYSADIKTTGKDFTTAAIDFTIDPDSIDTSDEKRDLHMKTSDFFDVQNHKEISFVSTSISKADENGNFDLWGELSIKGITRNIKLQASFGGFIMDPWGNERAGFTVTGKINRKEWDLNWNSSLEVGGVLLGDEVQILCEVQLVNSKKDQSVMELEAEENNN